MNRQEFMKRLGELLTDISEEEREEAIAYYTGYFEDAGIENEDKIIQELESPEKLAASIKAGLRSDEPEGEFTENGYQTNQEQKEHEARTMAAAKDTVNHGQNQTDYNRSMMIKLLAVVAILVTSPIWIGVLGGVFGVLMGIIGVLFAIIATLFATTIGCLCGGLAGAIVGIIRLCTGGLGSGLFLMGVSLLVMALGILALILLVLFCGKALPVMISGIVNLCKMPFNRKKKFI